jgi:hypothetical protein
MSCWTYILKIHKITTLKLIKKSSKRGALIKRGEQLVMDVDSGRPIFSTISFSVFSQNFPKVLKMLIKVAEKLLYSERAGENLREDLIIRIWTLDWFGGRP